MHIIVSLCKSNQELYKSNQESFAIKLSIYGSVITGTAGMLAAIFSNSRSLLFDALNTIIGIGITTAGLKISKLLKIKYSKRFNFGYYSLEPLFVLINGLIMLGLAVSLFISSVKAILDGGRTVELTIVTSYLIFSVVICTIEAVLLRYYSKKIQKSEIVRTEFINWMFDALTSASVLIAFLMSITLKNTSHRFLIPYFDPSITIILILCLVYQPFKLIKSGVYDLLRISPPSKVAEEIEEKLMSNKHNYGFTEIKIHSAKIGRTTCIEIICFYHKNFEIRTIETLDKLKNQIQTEVENYSQNLEVKVSFNTLE